MAEADLPISPELAMPTAEPRARAWRRRIIMLSVPVVLTAAAAAYYVANDHYVSTDNAYVQQEKVSISAEVGGRIVNVAVKENQLVRAGDLLFRIDPDPFENAVAQADATIASAQVRLSGLRTELQTTDVDIRAARQGVRFFEAEYQRQSALMERGFTTSARLQAAEHALSDARARLGDAEAEELKARAALGSGSALPGENPAIASGRVQRQKAMLDLARTEVRAPLSGQVSQTDRLIIGQSLLQGLPALTIVASDQSWIEANFKETDLNKMRVGQTAEIRFDAYPDEKITGRVASIGAGTGSEFSVLPSQNANGNWVKVTQRVPVRIAIVGRPARPMIAGLSAYVRIDTNSK